MEFESIEMFAGRKRPIIIAGPCSAENEEQVMAVASELDRKSVV